MEEKISEEKTLEKPKRDYALPASILISAIIIAGATIYTSGPKKEPSKSAAAANSLQKSRGTELEEKVVPLDGVVLPVTWGNLGAQLVKAGVIDADQLKTVYEGRGVPLTDEYKNLLLGENGGQLKITQDNANYLLNLFWALGLAQKNDILQSGEMVDQRYGGTQNFASTGGWTIGKGSAMDHYSRHTFFNLTREQQALVDKVAQGIYRPCCNNSTHFPDCNHGMAMLGLLELMASQGASEEALWRAALVANSYWFPDVYLTVATYMKSLGIDWKNVDPKEVLGINYSSASGFAKVAAQFAPSQSPRGGTSCGVGPVQPVQSQTPRPQSGCGI